MRPYYEHGGITLYHADCSTVVPLLGPTTVDLVLTDPPYAEETHQGARGGNSTRPLVSFPSTTSAELRFLMERLAPVCKAWFVATMDWHHIADLERCPPSGWRFVRFGVWIKPNGAPQFTGDRPATGWEGVAILHRDTGRMAWNGGGHHAVWTYNKIEGEHPTQKPIGLVARLIELFSNPGDLIFDPYAGSGTTLRAAKNLGRRAIGAEREERYCKVAAQRVAQEVLAL